MNTKTILLLELLMILRSRAWWTVCGLLVLLTGFSVFHGAGEHKVALENREAMFREEMQRLALMDATAVDVRQGGAEVSPWNDPTNPEVAGRRLGFRYAAKPYLPLGFSIVGQSDLQPDMLRVSTQPVEEWAYAHEWENPHRLFHGRFDLGFVLTFLLPLAVVVLASGVLSEEKERGTLALIQSQGASLRYLLLLKLGVRWVVLTCVVLASVYGCLALSVRFESYPFGEVLFDLFWLGFLLGIYLLAWFLVSAVVVSWLRSMAVSLGVLVGIWIGCLILAPAGANLMLDVLDATPGRYVYTDQMRRASQQATEEGVEALSEFYHDHPELTGDADVESIASFGATRTAVMLDVERRLAGMADEFNEGREVREVTVERIGVLVFPLFFQRAIMDLGGTGPDRHQHYLSEVSRYHRLYRTFFFERVVRGERFGAFHRIPSFEYREEHLRARWGRMFFDGALLLVLPAGVFSLRWLTWKE